MPTQAVAFLVGTEFRAPLTERLARLGFVAHAPRRAAWTLLDTFDGRLTQAGCIVTVTDGTRSGAELRLVDSNGREVRCPAPAALRFAADLPVGPLRGRLERLTDGRALLPVMRVSETTTAADRHDRQRKIVASATLHDRVTATGFDRVTGRARGSAKRVGPFLGITSPTGYDKFAKRTVDGLGDVAALGLREVGQNVIHAIADAAGISLGGIDTSPAVPLDPHMPAADGVRAVLAALAATVEQTRLGTIERWDTEFLHDLRVAVRRTRTVLGECRDLLPAREVERARELFGELGRLTGPARDLDVNLIEWDSYVGPLPPGGREALEPVRAVIEERRDAAYADLSAVFTSRSTTSELRAWTRVLAAPAEGASDGGVPALGPAIAIRVAKAERRLLRKGRAISARSPASDLHELRKDAKRLRYLLECFGTVLDDAPRRQYVARLKALQENLGEHQDAEVHADDLRRMGDDLARARTGARPRTPGAPRSPAAADPAPVIGTLTSLAHLVGRLDDRKLAARAEFAHRFSEFDTKGTHRLLDDLLEPLYAVDGDGSAAP